MLKSGAGEMAQDLRANHVECIRLSFIKWGIVVNMH